MDPRIREHAKIIVDYSAKVEAGDNVLIQAPPVAEDLVVALHEQLGERGANPLINMDSTRARRAFMRTSVSENFELPDHELASFQESDVVIIISGATNIHEDSDIDPKKNAALQTVRQPLQEELLESPWIGTQYPASGNAQAAEMSTEAYEDFVYGAINKDWGAQREHQQQLVELLDPASELRIQSGETTDITLNIDGMISVNHPCEHNIPDGEVFTAPVPDSVEGDVLFDMPLMTRGREVQDIYLHFEEGEVTDCSAEKNEEILAAILDTDDGARRLGEIGFGMNRDIDRFTYNMLFDEKMGDTIHLALGRAYEECIGENRERNDSAIHMDMIVDMKEDSTIEVDGEVIQRNGRFIFEDGFET